MSWRANSRRIAEHEARLEAERVFHTPFALMLNGHSVVLTCRNCGRAEDADLLAFEVAGHGATDLRQLALRMRCEKARGGCGCRGWVVVGVKR